MTVIRRYDEKDREQIIDLWKTCNLKRPCNKKTKSKEYPLTKLFHSIICSV